MTIHLYSHLMILEVRNLCGVPYVTANIRGLVARKKLQQDKANKALSMVKGVLDYSEFKDVDMVIEVTTGPILCSSNVPQNGFFFPFLLLRLAFLFSWRIKLSMNRILLFIIC